MTEECWPKCIDCDKSAETVENCNQSFEKNMDISNRNERNCYWKYCM